jgi:cytochrome c oxidase subunit II
MIGLFVESASTYADSIDNLILLIGVIVGFWGGVAMLTLFLFMWMFREKEGVPSQYVTGKEVHLKRWITIPHWLIIACDGLIIFGAVQVWYNVKQNKPTPEQIIRVTGAQWTWLFQHPGPDGELDTDDDIRTSDDLHVEVDTVYHFQLEATDVMHSFSIPVFRLKQDAIPGRRITGWFEATTTGEFDIQCAEMCGIGHGLMQGRIHIETPQEHAAWMAGAALRN